jgi:hypothetical protein
MHIFQLWGALGRLLSVGEQRHAWGVDAHHSLRERCAHMRELDEVLGPAADVGTDVEHHDRRGAGTRDRECQRWTVDATVTLEVEEAGSECRAG